MLRLNNVSGKSHTIYRWDESEPKKQDAPLSIGGYGIILLFSSVCSRFIRFACLEVRFYVPIYEIYLFDFLCVSAYNKIIGCIHIYPFLFYSCLLFNSESPRCLRMGECHQAQLGLRIGDLTIKGVYPFLRDLSFVVRKFCWDKIKAEHHNKP